MSQDLQPEPTGRKPRIALMGEFSAGKSTLANLLLGQTSSPVQVTATQLPPVWYSLGDTGASRIARDGQDIALPPGDWSAATPVNTQLINARMEADLLYAFDLIDMPGTSDPHMATDIWSRFMPLMDVVIWCSPANQAWRQSEAALWEQMPEALWCNSLLLITRMDKMTEARDRDRVLSRVRAEAGACFRDVLPISLTQALNGREDAAILESSGATALVAFLETVLDNITLEPKPGFVPDMPAPQTQRPAAQPKPANGARNAVAGKVMPRRITRNGGASSRERPAARPG